MNHPTDRIVHTTAFVTPVVEREIANGFTMKDRFDDPRSYISIPMYLCAY